MGIITIFKNSVEAVPQFVTNIISETVDAILAAFSDKLSIDVFNTKDKLQVIAAAKTKEIADIDAQIMALNSDKEVAISELSKANTALEKFSQTTFTVGITTA